MQQEVKFSQRENTLTARICRDIDHHTAKAMREAIDEMLLSCKAEILVLDFSEVGFMDSSGIGLILGRVEFARTHRASVRLVGLSPTLLKLVRLSGIERVKNLSVMK